MTLTQKIVLKLLWLRKSYTFLWAHKPLCQTFREDVIQIGSIYLCRSCTLLYSGMSISLLVSIFWSEYLSSYGEIFTGVIAIVVFPLSAPVIYKKLGRVLRDLLRFFLGAVMGLLPYLILSGKIMLVCSLAAISLFLWYFYSKKRRKRKIMECESCPKFSENEICEGYELQAESVRQYEIRATSYLEDTGYIPASLKNRAD